MAQDLSGSTFIPTSVKRVTLGDADDLTEVTLHTATTHAGLRFVTNDGKWATSGTDGAAIGSDYATVTADGWLFFSYTKNVIYLAGSVNATVVEVVQADRGV